MVKNIPALRSSPHFKRKNELKEAVKAVDTSKLPSPSVPPTSTAASSITPASQDSSQTLKAFNGGMFLRSNKKMTNTKLKAKVANK